MSFVGDFISDVVPGAGAVMDIVGAGANALGFGSKGGSKSETKIAPPTAAELAQRQQQQDLINKMLAEQNAQHLDPQLMQQFRSLLTQTLTGTNNPSPDQIKQATSFVDETFTKPAQQQFDTFANDFMAKQAQRSAVAGRQVTDPALQNRALSTLAPLNAQIGLQRGAQIAQQSEQIAQRDFMRPQQQLGFASEGLNFFNNLNQQALKNRIALSNLLGNQQQLGLADRTGNSVTSATSDVSFGTGLAGLGGAISGAAPALKGLGGIFSSNAQQQQPQAQSNWINPYAGSGSSFS